MPGHALTPGTRRSLGRPLPCQQADRTWTAPKPPELCPKHHAMPRDHRVLPALSPRSPDCSGDAAIPVSGVRCPCIPHPFAANLSSGFPLNRSARLACLSHAASVRSEPGSNSSLESSFPSASAPKGPSGQIRQRAIIHASVRMKTRRCLATPAIFSSRLPGKTPARAGGFQGHPRRFGRNRARPSHSHDDKPVHLSKSIPPAHTPPASNAS